MTSIRIATCNTKGGTDSRGLRAGGTRGNSAWRATQIRGALADAEVTIACLQEMSGHQALVLANTDWRLEQSRPNTVTRKGATVGNAILIDRNSWGVRGRHEITVRGLRLRPSRLHFPVVLLSHEDTHARLAVASVHFPSGLKIVGLRRRARERCARVVRSELQRIVPNGVPVLIAGDFNQEQTPAAFNGWLHTVRHKIDWIVSSEHLGGKRVHHFTLDDNGPGWSDHDGISAVLTLPDQPVAMREVNTLL